MIDGIKPPAKRPAGKTNSAVAEIDEPAFKPPEAVAAAEATPELTDVVEGVAEKPTFARASDKSKRRNPIRWFAGLPASKKVPVALLAVLILGGSSTLAYMQLNKAAPVASTPVIVADVPEPPKEVIIYSPLSGVAVTKEQSELPVIGVMIENSPDARPQSGLNQAGVVFEAIAEGGITRFLALFQENQPDYVGPVRSVRPYYVDWLQGFDAAVAHVGGSAEALAKIKNEGVKDLDQFANSGPYRRVNNRYAPHNMYTSMAGLTDLSKSKGLTTSKFTGFARKADAPSSAPTARTIDITISGALYNVRYDYDLTSNTYKRSLAGKAHLDERSKEQLSPKVVIALVTPYSIHADRIHSVYQTIGTGKAYIFQDGVAIEATWEKPDAKTQLSFKDATGKPVQINAGQTWITATSIANNVIYKP